MNRSNTGRAIGALTPLTACVEAQTPSPSKPIRLIAPLAAGGASDAAAHGQYGVAYRGAP